MQKVSVFFENYPSIKNSVITVSLPWDNTMLEGKWRVLSKPYQMIHTLGNFPNKDNWMQRFSTRGSDFLLSLKEQGADISRFEISLGTPKSLPS